MLNCSVGTDTGQVNRTWNDDALVHHSTHVLDLCQWMFGPNVTVKEVICPMDPTGYRNAGLLLNGPGSFSINAILTYDAPCSMLRMAIVMEQGVIAMDGFARLTLNGDEDITTDRLPADDDAYHDAVIQQDLEFFEVVYGRAPYAVSVDNSFALIHTINCAVGLANKLRPPHGHV